jgi:hypothetical protein
VGETATNTTYYKGKQNIPDFKAPRHCPFALLVKIWRKVGKALGSEFDVNVGRLELG